MEQNRVGFLLRGPVAVCECILAKGRLRLCLYVCTRVRRGVCVCVRVDAIRGLDGARQGKRA